MQRGKPDSRGENVMRGQIRRSHRSLAWVSALLTAGSAWAQAPAPQAPAPLVVSAPAGPAPTNRAIAIRDIDREMTNLSNDIAQSHARLQAITGMVLEQSGGGAQLIIEHQNQMGATFRLVRATYSLDGSPVATRVDENGSLAEQQGFPVFNGRVSSGEHSVTVSLEYQGNGYGIFSYIRGYTFRSRSVQNFTVPEGRALRMVVVGYERGGATTAIEDRPAIRYESGEMTLQAAQALVSAAQPPQGTSGAQGAQPARTP